MKVAPERVDLFAGRRRTALCGCIALFVVMAWPQVALAAHQYTGGAHGYPANANWYTWGTEQFIETRIPDYESPYGGNAEYVSEVNVDGTDCIAQIGVAYVGNTFQRPWYFYEFESDNGYPGGAHYFGGAPVNGVSHRYTMYENLGSPTSGLWIGLIDLNEVVHTGASNLGWSPNAVQHFGEIQTTADYFSGRATNHCSFDSDRWMDANQGWHGGLLYQAHIGSLGLNDISGGVGSYTIWDSRS